MDSIEAVIQRLEQGNIPVQRLRIKENQVFTLTAGELEACVKKNPKHPYAQIFLGAVQGLPPDHEVHVDIVDLQALLENKTVRVHEEQNVKLVGGKQTIETTQRKVLQDEKADPANTAAGGGQ